MRAIKALFLTAGLALAPTLPAFAEGATLAVTGIGTVNVTPDMASLSLGVTSNGPTAVAAMAATNAALAAVSDRLKASGIAPADMQTSNLSLYPNWVGYDSGAAPTIDGYVASNMLTVQVRALDQTGAVLDAVITDGANTLNSLTFGLSNPRPAEDDARRAAVSDARARAEVLATAAGVKLGDLISISEGGAMTDPMPMFRADAASAPVEAGQLAVTASVTLIFNLVK